MPLKRRDGPLRFAEDFSAFLAREGLRIGKVRVRPASSFLDWSKLCIRKSGGSLERLALSVALRMHLYLYGPCKITAEEAERLKERGRVFARRHRLILAEQVLASNVGDGDVINKRRVR